MEKMCSLSKFAAICFFISAAFCSAETQDDWAREAATVLVSPKSGRVPGIPPDAITLLTQTVKVTPNSSVEDLLISNGIYVNAESFETVYRLNPGLKSLKIVTEGELVLPKVSGSAELESLLAEGALVAITLDVQLKGQILELAKSVKPLARKLLSPAFQYPISNMDSVRKATDTAINFVEAMEALIREPTRPLNKEMLQQIHVEVAVFQSKLSLAVDPERAFTQDDANTLMLIAENMRVRETHFAGMKDGGQLPSPYPTVMLKVNALVVGTNQPAHQLRVYYIPQALYGLAGESEFAELTSPAAAYLPVANYKIWVGKPGDATPLSDVLSVKVRQQPAGNPMAADLVVR